MMPASAFRPDGMTVIQLAKAALDMLKAGYEAEAVNTFLGLGDLAHTGVVPRHDDARAFRGRRRPGRC